MPKKGPDPKKVNKILNILKKNPEGLWVREIAKRAGLDKSTVSIYLSKHLKKDVSTQSISGLVKIYKIKNG